MHLKGNPETYCISRATIKGVNNRPIYYFTVIIILFYMLVVLSGHTKSRYLTSGNTVTCCFSLLEILHRYTKNVNMGLLKILKQLFVFHKRF